MEELDSKDFDFELHDEATSNGASLKLEPYYDVFYKQNWVLHSFFKIEYCNKIYKITIGPMYLAGEEK